MNFLELLSKRRLDKAFNQKEIDYIVQNYTQGNISDFQMVQLIDLFLDVDMQNTEVVAFFDAQFRWGKKMDLSDIKGFKVDKHSTGGVGDKVSLILLPILEALGIKVFKLSGGRLGFTGGTIEKLQTFPGINLKFSIQQFQERAHAYNVVLGYTVDEISTFEQKLYKLRNLTKKTNVLGMVVNSVMIKKMLLMNDGLIIDVKCGSGAFFKNLSAAERFAELALIIAKKYHRKIALVITDMNEPLGFAIGNKPEVIEVINTLENKGPQDLLEVVHSLVFQVLLMHKKVKTFQESYQKVVDVLQSGKALNCFRHFVESQGGNFNAVYHNLAINSKHVIEIKSWDKGYLVFSDTSAIGLFVNNLTMLKKQQVDYESGVVLVKKMYDYVNKNEVIAKIYSNKIDQNNLIADFQKHIYFSETKPQFLKSKIFKVIKHF